MDAGKIPKKFEWTAQAVSDFWDCAANSPLMKLSFARQCAPELGKLISGLVPKETAICDFGAGSGDLIRELLKLGYRAGAYEPSEGRMADFPQAIRENPSFLGFQADIKYGCVTCFEVLEHVMDQDMADALGAIQDLLAPDGIFIGSCPWDENLENNFCICPACHTMFHRWQHMRSFNPDSMTRLLLSHGFSSVRIFKADFTRSLFFTARKQGWSDPRHG